MSGGSNLVRVKDYNESVVLDVIRRRGPVSRPQLVNLTGLRFQTVSNIVQRLADSQMITDVVAPTGDGARRSRYIGLNETAAYAVGLHLDRLAMRAVLCTLTGRVIARLHLPDVAQGRPESFVEDAPATVERLAATAGIPTNDILGVGVALPGPIDLRSGNVLRVPNFPDWHDFPLRERLAKRLEVDVQLDTDTTAAALGERWAGLGVGVTDFAYVYCGAGIGAGLVLNGEPMRGWLGNVGQIGHLRMGPEGLPCPCGKTACVEAVASLSEVLATAGLATPDLGTSDIDSLDVNLLDDTSTARMQAAVSNAGRAIGLGVSALVAVADPELVVVGGPLTALAPEQLVDAIRVGLDEHLLPGRPRPAIETSQLKSDAGPLGAAALALHHQFAPSSQRLRLT
jgi:predicted NBD/HSP70 family sugar kinase